MTLRGDTTGRVPRELAAYRQRVNEALSTLSAKGWIRVEYGGVRVLDLQALRQGEL